MITALARRAVLTASLLILTACGAATDGDATSALGSEADATPMPALEGDMSCFTPGVSWQEQLVSDSAVVDGPVEITVKPLGKDDAMGEVEVGVWFSNSVDGEPDVRGLTDLSGQLQLTLPLCTPVTYRALRVLDTEVTYKANMVFNPAAPTADFTVVENVTAASIQAMLTESADAMSSIVAGTAYDCAGEPLANARVRLRDSNGEIWESGRDYYFNAAGYPTKRRHQDYTNVDGKWVLFDVPQGDVFIELYGNVCGTDGRCDELVLGTSPITSIGESINIGNVFAGVQSGVSYPSACLQ